MTIPNEYSTPLPEESSTSRPYTDYRNAKYDIVSIVAYLIGVEKEHFEHDYSQLQMEIYENSDKDKNARIIRNLCRVRTALMRNYSAIRTEFSYSYKNIGSLPDLIPSDAVKQLFDDGIQLQKSRPTIENYILAINKEISNRIGNCAGLFPEWLNWMYIKALFLMPNGTKVEGIKAAGIGYSNNKNKYPYQCYINWTGRENGNILYNDEKFVTMLYEANEDYFSDLSLVRDAGDIALDNIESFMAQSTKAIIAVDCENSDPIRLAAALSSLSKSGLGKIVKVLLFDSDYTSTEWEIFSDAEAKAAAAGKKNWSILTTLAAFPIERITVERINEHKSQVDMTLVAATCKEVYTNGVDSVVLVSSDSDYWALIKSLADVSFLVMVEKDKCGEAIKRALDERGIHYCYLDDFYTGASQKIKTIALVSIIQSNLDRQVSINARTILDNALNENWVKMSPKERNAFYDRYLRKMKVAISPDGDVRLVLGE